MYEYLIDVIPGPPLKQEGVGDDRATRLFVALWNKKYADLGYWVKRVWSDHDFGAYPSVGIKDAALQRGLYDDKTFKDGIERAALELCDEWNARIEARKVSLEEWRNIISSLALGDVPPFKIEY